MCSTTSASRPRRVGRGREARQCIDGQASQPLALGDDPVVVTGWQQISSVAVHRLRRIAACDRVDEHHDVDCRSRAPPHGAAADVHELDRAGQRPPQVVEQLAQVGSRLRGARVRPQLARQLLPWHASAAGEGQPRDQPRHARTGEDGDGPSVHRGRDLAEQPDLDVTAARWATCVLARRRDGRRPGHGPSACGERPQRSGLLERGRAKVRSAHRAFRWLRMSSRYERRERRGASGAAKYRRRTPASRAPRGRGSS